MMLLLKVAETADCVARDIPDDGGQNTPAAGRGADDKNKWVDDGAVAEAPEQNRNVGADGAVVGNAAAHKGNLGNHPLLRFLPPPRPTKPAICEREISSGREHTQKSRATLHLRS
jgi:hypothetical protein